MYIFMLQFLQLRYLPMPFHRDFVMPISCTPLPMPSPYTMSINAPPLPLPTPI